MKKRLNLTRAELLADFKDKQEQKDLAEALKNSIEQRVKRQSELLTLYKKAPEDIRQSIRSGERDLLFVNVPQGKKVKKIERDEKFQELLDGLSVTAKYYSADSFLEEVKNTPIRKIENEEAREIMTQIYHQIIDYLVNEIEDVKKGGKTYGTGKSKMSDV